MAIIGIASSLLSSITNLALVSIPIQEAKVAFDRMFEYSSIPKEKTEGSKKKELVTRVHHIAYSEIKETKKILKFLYHICYKTILLNYRLKCWKNWLKERKPSM